MDNSIRSEVDINLASLILQDLLTSFGLDEQIYRNASEKIIKLSSHINNDAEKMPATA